MKKDPASQHNAGELPEQSSGDEMSMPGETADNTRIETTQTAGAAQKTGGLKVFFRNWNAKKTLIAGCLGVVVITGVVVASVYFSKDDPDPLPDSQEVLAGQPADPSLPQSLVESSQTESISSGSESDRASISSQVSSGDSGGIPVIPAAPSSPYVFFHDIYGRTLRFNRDGTGRVYMSQDKMYNAVESDGYVYYSSVDGIKRMRLSDHKIEVLDAQSQAHDEVLVLGDTVYYFVSKQADPGYIKFMCMNLDGTNKMVLKEHKYFQTSSGMAYRNGCLYYGLNGREYVEDDGNLGANVYKYDLSTKKCNRIINGIGNTTTNGKIVNYLQDNLYIFLRLSGTGTLEEQHANSKSILGVLDKNDNLKILVENWYFGTDGVYSNNNGYLYFSYGIFNNPPTEEDRTKGGVWRIKADGTQSQPEKVLEYEDCILGQILCVMNNEVYYITFSTSPVYEIVAVNISTKAQTRIT